MLHRILWSAAAATLLSNWELPVGYSAAIAFEIKDGRLISVLATLYILHTLSWIIHLAPAVYCTIYLSKRNKHGRKVPELIRKSMYERKNFGGGTVH